MTTKLSELYLKLISYSGKTGPSSVKFVWLHAGIAAVYSSVLVTIGGVSVYVFQHVADPIYWAGCASMWTVTIGFAQSVKKNQDNLPPTEG